MCSVEIFGGFGRVSFIPADMGQGYQIRIINCFVAVLRKHQDTITFVLQKKRVFEYSGPPRRNISKIFGF